MLTQSEILSVLEMLRNENLDVRTVTLGLNLLDCASDDIDRFCTRIYDRITQTAEQLVPVCDAVGEKFGIPVVNKRISVSPMAVAAAPFNRDEMVSVAQTLDKAVHAVEVDFIGVVHQAVEDSVGQRGVADHLMPMFDR